MTYNFYALQLLAVFLAALMLSSCRSAKSVSDTTNLFCDTTIIFSRSVQIDTAEIYIPYQKDADISLDSVSVVQTDFAISEARITKEGQLIHTIENKPTKTKALIKADTTTSQVTIWHKSALHTESEKTQEKGLPIDRFYLPLLLFAFASVFVIYRLYK